MPAARVQGAKFRCTSVGPSAVTCSPYHQDSYNPHLSGAFQDGRQLAWRTANAAHLLRFGALRAVDGAGTARRAPSPRPSPQMRCRPRRAVYFTILRLHRLCRRRASKTRSVSAGGTGQHPSAALNTDDCRTSVAALQVRGLRVAPVGRPTGPLALPSTLGRRAAQAGPGIMPKRMTTPPARAVGSRLLGLLGPSGH